jgi:hypothetical protein
MAVAVTIDFEGATLDQYDEVIGKMGFTPGGSGGPGGIFHWVTATDDGIRVTDVWESREAFEDFAKSTMRPLVADAGITTEPKITLYEVHNYLTAG